MKKINKKYKVKDVPIWIEKISLKIMQFLLILIRFTRIQNQELLDRMEHVEKVKHPYGLYDLPKKMKNLYTHGDS